MKNFKLLFISLALILPSMGIYGQLNKESEKIFKENFYAAEKVLADGNYINALPLFKDLNALDPKNANINWRIGVCYLNSATEKANALPFLEKAMKKIETLKYDDATDIIFGDILRKAENKKSKSREITDFFSVSRKKK